MPELLVYAAAPFVSSTVTSGTDNSLGPPDGTEAVVNNTSSTYLGQRASFDMSALPDDASVWRVTYGARLRSSTTVGDIQVNLRYSNGTAVEVGKLFDPAISLTDYEFMVGVPITVAELKTGAGLQVGWFARSASVAKTTGCDAFWLRVVYTTADQPVTIAESYVVDPAAGGSSGFSALSLGRMSGPPDGLTGSATLTTAYANGSYNLSALAQPTVSEIVQVLIGARTSVATLAIVPAISLTAGDTTPRTISYSSTALKTDEFILDPTLFTPELLTSPTTYLRYARTGSTTGTAYLDAMWIRVSYLAAAAAARSKRWDGSQWVDSPIKRWDGTRWITTEVKGRWTGTEWV